jgi:hypothetical protein
MPQQEKKKKQNEDILEIGRTMGALSRTDEEIWAAVEKEAILTGRRKHDIIAEKIAKALIIEEVVQRGLTMEQLLAAWELKDRIEALLFKKVMTLGTTFFGTLLQQVGELVAGISQYQKEQIDKMVEEEKKKDIEYQLKITKARMNAMLLNTLIPPMMNILTGMLKGMSATQLIQPQQTTEEKKTKPTVEIIDD